MKKVSLTAQKRSITLFQFIFKNIVNYVVWLSEPSGKHLVDFSSYSD
jgi:hypothetical protein